jgi:hypothetical protein
MHSNLGSAAGARRVLRGGFRAADTAEEKNGE